MKHFTIENDTNNIMVHGSVQEAEAVANAERFSDEAEMAMLAADWPAARLVEIWNSLPGVTPVTKFKDRTTGVSRIWKAIQTLGQAEPVTSESETTPVLAKAFEAPETGGPEASIPEATDPAPDSNVAPQSPDVASDAAPARTKATRAKKAPKTAMGLGTPREGSKTSKVIAMLKGEGGVTLEEIMAAMGWLKHTTRAMLSAGGSLTKKHGLVIVSEKVGEKRTYRIAG